MTDKPGWDAKDELRGIRGWLLLPLIHLIFNSMYLIWLVVRDLPLVAARALLHPLAAQVEFVLLLLPVFAFLIFCLVRLLQERREVPWLMTVFYGINIAVVLALLIARAKGYDFPDQFEAKSLVAGHTVPSFMQLALSVALIGYFHSSVRVRNTFFRRAPPRAERAGIGGWLVVVLVPVAFWIAVLVSVIHSPLTLPQRIAWSIAHGTIYLYRLIASEAIAAFVIYSIVRFFQKRRGARVLMMIVALTAIAYIAIFTLLPQPHALKGGAVLVAIWAAIGAYFWRSTRVKNTFVR